MSQSYPRLVIGQQVISPVLQKLPTESRLYICDNITKLRAGVEEVILSSSKSVIFVFYLRYPQRAHFDCLLKIIEDSSNKIIILTPEDNVPDTIVSRCVLIKKKEKLEFRDYLDKAPMSRNIKSKVFTLFNRSIDDD